MTNLRWRLIRWLAGKRPVALNLDVRGGLRLPPGDGLVSDCTFTRPEV